MSACASVTKTEVRTKGREKDRDGPWCKKSEPITQLKSGKSKSLRRVRFVFGFPSRWDFSLRVVHVLQFLERTPGCESRARVSQRENKRKTLTDGLEDSQHGECVARRTRGVRNVSDMPNCKCRVTKGEDARARTLSVTSYHCRSHIVPRTKKEEQKLNRLG